MNLDHDRLVDLFVNKARLALNDGETFNPGGQGFMRLNVAVPKSVLRDAMERLCNAVRNYAHSIDDRTESTVLNK